jgi:uncharacterized membrane protein YhaH (DUF805 family)
MMDLLFSFRGRINRAKFWLAHLGVVVVEMIILAIVFSAAGLASADFAQGKVDVGLGPSIIFAILAVVVIWIGLALAVKRWHDRNKSAWWLLLPVVPVVGPIWAIVELGFLKGTTGPNSYGPDPLLAG